MIPLFGLIICGRFNEKWDVFCTDDCVLFLFTNPMYLVNLITVHRSEILIYQSGTNLDWIIVDAERQQQPLSKREELDSNFIQTKNRSIIYLHISCMHLLISFIHVYNYFYPHLHLLFFPTVIV